MSDDSHLQPPDSGTGTASSKPSQIQLLLRGHLSESALVAELDRADHELLGVTNRPVLVVNCLTMTGYDSAARSMFVSWNSRQKRKFLCVVVITENKLWHMVVSSMALASGQKMKAFNTLALAAPWISEQWAHSHALSAHG
jgi:hypothetical protein